MSDLHTRKSFPVRLADALWAAYSIAAMLFVMIFGRWMGDE